MRGHLQLACAIGLLIAPMTLASGRYYEVKYEPSAKAGELQLGVTYTLWIPDGVKQLRAIIVHQHGCGAPACQGGATAAYDLHWQALARKWDCALLGPSYQQSDEQPCSLWCDPRQGSDKAFLNALSDFATRSDHPELKRIPWCLWGHSGGGYWAGIMQILHPNRIVATWFRSGTASLVLQKSEPKLQIPAALYSIPMMCNPGVKEKDHKQFGRVWTSTLDTFNAYRAAGAPIAIAPDPRTSHECGDSRYLAIPFFDACLSMRLPPVNDTNQSLRPIDMSQAWLAEPLTADAVPAARYKGDRAKAVWLPNESFARLWMQYVRAGSTQDQTPPPPSHSVQVQKTADGLRITWDADADLESGIQSFLILRDGQPLAQVPEKPIGRFGRPLFQTMSYHDTPEKPLPEMSWIDRAASNQAHEYQVITVNSAGLKSTPSEKAKARR